MSKLKVLGIIVAIAAVVGAVKFMGADTGTTTKGARVQPPNQSGHVFFGVTMPSGPYSNADLDAFEQAAGKKTDAVLFSQFWPQDGFRRDVLARLDSRGKTPIISWEPRDHSLDATCGGPHPDQPDYALSRIIAGAFDDYVRQWATGLRDWRKTVGLRFAPEMNGNWFPWSEGVNGNQPGEYVAAWRHVRQIFDDVGARNVIWVWSPNIRYAGSTPLAQLYPGDQYVDWVGIDGYNGGTALPWGGWLPFDQLIGPTLGEVQSLTQKPVVLTSVASAEAGGSKAAWISDFFAKLPSYPQIIGFVWVEGDREADWRIVSSDSATEAFRRGISAPIIGPGRLLQPA